MQSEDRLTAAVGDAIEHVPISRRELARRSGLAHTTLNRIAHGQQRATVEIAEALAAALDEVAGAAGRARDAIREAVSREKNREVEDADEAR